VLHGPLWRGRTVKGALELSAFRIPAGLMGSALAMDKWRTKLVWREAAFRLRTRAPYAKSDLQGVATRLGLPLNGEAAPTKAHRSG